MNTWKMDDYKEQGEFLLRKLPKWRQEEVRAAALQEWKEKGGKLLYNPHQVQTCQSGLPRTQGLYSSA